MEQVVISKEETKKTTSMKKADVTQNEHIIKLSKAYKFEDEGEISSLDLSCLKDATAEVLMKASRVLTANGEVMAVPENDIRYALFVAAECTSLPHEFYHKLNLPDAIKVKREVLSFFNGME